MCPNFYLEHTQSPHFNPFAVYDEHNPFPLPEFDTFGEQLPPLEDVDHTLNHYNNQFHDHTPKLDQSTNLNSKSKSTIAASLELLSRYSWAEHSEGVFFSLEVYF